MNSTPRHTIMSLSELSYYVRKYGPVALIGFTLFIIFFGIFRILFSLSTGEQIVQPKQYEPPFGILEPITFTHSIPYPENVTFTIDNIEGRPLEIAQEGDVYYIPPRRTRFGYQQTIAFMAKAVGFDTESQSYTLDNTTATYQDELRKLVIDITTYNFSFELDYKKVPTLFSDTTTPSDITIKEEAKSFLRKMNKFSSELAQGSQNIIYQRYDPATDTFTHVDNPEEANVVEVDFFVPDINSWPAVSPKYFNSHTYVTMVFNAEKSVVIKAQAPSFERDLASPGKYPLKTGAQTWDELVQKKGVIVSPSKGGTDIVVRDMFLGYYWPDTYQPYMQPVYVFLGDNGFAALVPAVRSDLVKGGPILTTPVPTSVPQPTLEPVPTDLPLPSDPVPTEVVPTDEIIRPMP